MSNKVEVISLQDVSLVHPTGHSVIIKANQPIEILERLLPMARERGCVPTSTLKGAQQAVDNGVESTVKEVPANGAAPPGKTHDQLLLDAVAIVLTRGDENDIKKTGEGEPKAFAVAKELPEGTDFSAGDVYKAFATIRMEAGLNKG